MQFQTLFNNKSHDVKVKLFNIYNTVVKYSDSEYIYGLNNQTFDNYIKLVAPNDLHLENTIILHHPLIFTIIIGQFNYLIRTVI